MTLEILDEAKRGLSGRGNFHDAFKKLSQTEQIVLSFRYGLGRGEPRTLEQTANKIGSTRERVRIIQREAEKQLKTLGFTF